MKGHALYVKHQADYHKFFLSNLHSGDVLVIVNYKMKLELVSVYLNVSGIGMARVAYHSMVYLSKIVLVSIFSHWMFPDSSKKGLTSV